MDALPATPRQRLFAAFLLVASAAGCGGAAGDTTPTSPPAAATPAATAAVATAGADPAAPTPDGATTGGLLAIAESLAPPDGAESGRQETDASAGIIWFTPRSLEELQAHYEGQAAGGGWQTLVDSQAGSIQSWVLGGLPHGPVNASIQVTPTGTGDNRVQVTITPQ